jgi:nucleoid-associated protein YgaU
VPPAKASPVVRALGQNLAKAVIANTVTNQRIEVQFNPGEYTLNRDNTFAQAAVPGSSAPLIQFVHGNLQTLEMELLLDTYEAHAGANANSAGDDVRPLVRKLTDLMNIDETTHAPPVLLFTWGSLSFTCVLSRAIQKFVLFRPDGVPVRARVQATFGEFRNADLEAKEIKRETADYSKVHLVAQGETLSAIAARAYGNPAAWRPIAIRNGIDDPRVLEVGSRLLIPRLPFQDPETGEVMRA